MQYLQTQMHGNASLENDASFKSAGWLRKSYYLCMSAACRLSVRAKSVAHPDAVDLICIFRRQIHPMQCKKQERNLIFRHSVRLTNTLCPFLP
ncbi:hypothetical protein TNCV_690421 [Trichonephila clavipes]|nr:hypothetical protein TNCV_690421 [Trichonephila clavipes]